ncbi:hypothetical protein A3864_12885 (plasmid) [Priestia endophytica]|uniref:HTH merR-type domain-containing protein n=1 Tax=Priestia endophytica TaxID=135735 RepID=A0AAX1Q7N0_9BACI|nr:hypothetical protein A3864_12885 [Priestia endophytica]
MKTKVKTHNENLSENENQTSDNIDDNSGDIKLTIKEAAQKVDESVHVVRNWMKELKNHIPTLQGENGYHYFDKSSIEQLLLIKKLSRDQGYSIKQINHYLSTGDDPLKPARTPEDPVMLELEVIKEHLKRQEEFNQALINRLEKQQEYIQNSLEKRDQQLLDVVKETQQAKSEVAATKKKGFFARLFS